MRVIYTIDYEKEIWSLLGLFESTKYVMDLIASRSSSISDEELVPRTTNVAYCVRQAREYFASANTVSLLTSPLLLSYGMLNLAKAAVMLRLPSHRDIDSLFSKHGVTVDFTTLDSNISDVELSIMGYGVLPQMIESFQEPLYSGWSMSLDQLISQIPDLHEIYSLVYKKAPRTLSVKRVDNGWISNDVKGSDLDEFADGLRKILDAVGAKGHVIFRSNQRFSITKTIGACKSLKEIGILVRSMSGKEFLRIAPILDGVPLLLGDITLSYLIVFCYGMLARYKAACWGQYTGSSDSSEAELIRRSLQVCRHRFLHGNVNALFEEEYEFRVYVEHSEKSKKELIDFIYDDLVRKMGEDLRRKARGRGLRW